MRALAAAASRIRHLHLADSIGIDFHKTGFVPVYLVAVPASRPATTLRTMVRGSARRCPICITRASIIPACSRSKLRGAATGVMAALANLLLLGKEGFRTLIGHAVEMAEVLRELIDRPAGAVRCSTTTTSAR